MLTEAGISSIPYMARYLAYWTVQCRARIVLKVSVNVVDKYSN